MIKETEAIKSHIANFGRTFALLLNRSFMYSINHPFQVEAINSTYQALTRLLQNLSPVVFILNGEKFYVDEESLDPRLNVSKIATLFKKTGMESISFYRGVNKKDLQFLLEITASQDKYSSAEAMSRALLKKRVNNIKINHIFYKKVSAEDEIVSRDVLNKVTPEMLGENQEEVKKMFMESIFNSVLQEDFVQGLNLDNILMDPDDLSQKMINADLKTVRHYENNKTGTGENKNTGEINDEKLLPGQVLLHQLEVIDEDVEKNLSKKSKSDLPKIADALFDMRRKLIEGIEAQKALGIAYANEEEVLSKTSQITDKVIIRLIKEEYKGGEITVLRLAQILRRLIPEADELKRLLPKIKTALIGEGMSQDEFMALIQALGKELQNDNLVGILSENAEEIGVDGQDIIQQIKENPLQSAEMLYLASEIKKRGVDERALTDLIVDYLEKIGSKYSKDITGKNGENRIQQALVQVKSSLVQHLGSMDIKEDLLDRLEERINQRMDDVLNKLRLEWINTHSVSREQESFKELSVLETLERGASEEDELGQILKIIRKKAETGEIDENDFDQIYPEIVRQEQLRKSRDEKKVSLSGIMREEMLMSYLDKELARAKRYKTSLSVLGFALVKIKAKTNTKDNKVSSRDVKGALLKKLVEIFRIPDIIGEVRKNLFIVLLPMTHEGQANLALRRSMKILHLTPLEVSGIPLEIKVAGVVADINLDDGDDSESLVERLSSQLKDMATRIGNLHAYY